MTAMTPDPVDFDLQAPLGSGGMGEVWQAVHRDSGIHVAIKWLRGSGDALEREIRLVAGLCHPHIGTVLDLGSTGERTWFAMELADQTLSDVGGDWPWLRDRLVQLLGALAHAHARGVIHRDLKPANVLLRGVNQDVMLVDFGIAARLKEQGAPRGGTPLFMAPEQIMDQLDSQGPWTDLYALGAMTWLLVCGSAPFWAPNVAEILTSHLTKELPVFRPRMPVPAGLDTWLCSLLAKRPSDRPRCAAEALDSLPTGPVVHVDSRVMQVSLAETVEIAPLDELDLAAVKSVNQTAPFDPLAWKSPDTPIDDLARASLRLLALRTIPLVGREVEREALWSALAEVYRTGEPRGVVLTGAPGIGKTRLADWLATRAHESGAAVSRSVEDLDDHDRPVVVILDDDADGSDAERARKILRGRTFSVLVVLVADRIPRGFDAFVDVSVIELGRLSDAETGRLAWEMLHLEGGLPSELVRDAGGRPLHVTQLIAHWIDRDVLLRTGRGFALSEPTSLPSDALWDERVRDLFEDATSMRLAAMLGPRVDHDIWSAACAILGVPASTRRLEQAGLVERDAHHWTFRHLGLRIALLALGTDVALHEACADALAGSTQVEMMLMRGEHLVGAKRPVEALEQLTVAARMPTLRTLRAPLGSALRLALEAAGSEPSLDSRMEAWNSLGVSYSSTGHNREAIDAAMNALNLAPDPSSPKALDALRLVADAHYRLGDLEAAERSARDALRYPQEAKQRANCIYILFCIYRRQGRFDLAITEAEQLRVHVELGALQAQIFDALTWVHLQAGDLVQASASNKMARRRALSNKHFGPTAYLDNMDGEIARARGAPMEAVRAYTASRDAFVSIGVPAQCIASCNLGIAWLSVGVEHAEKARLAFEFADRRSPGFAPDYVLPVTAVGLAACQAVAGRLDRATDCLNRAEELLVKGSYLDPDVKWLLELAAVSDPLRERVAEILARLQP